VQHVAAAAPPLSATWPDAPRALEWLIKRMLAKDPEGRPDVDTVDRALGQILCGL
jgi:hypothetical protein